jgi:hypothetical protein
VKKRYPKLSPREKKLAAKYIPEEIRTGKYKMRQAVKVGIERARRRVALEKEKPKSRSHRLHSLFRKHEIR